MGKAKQPKKEPATLTIRKYNRKALDVICQDTNVGSYSKAIHKLINGYEQQKKEITQLIRANESYEQNLQDVEDKFQSIKVFGKILKDVTEGKPIRQAGKKIKSFGVLGELPEEEEDYDNRD